MPKINGTATNDTLVGTDFADAIYGFSGDDSLIGDLGDDYIDGSDGNDSIFGGAGNDELYGGIGNDQIFGGDNDDLIFGEDGDDLIEGQNGNDTLFAGFGSDTLVGGAGHDSIVVEGFDDGVQDIFLGGAGDDTIGIYSGDSADGGDGNDMAYIVLRFLPGTATVNTTNMTIDLSQANMNSVASALLGGTVTGFERWGVYTGGGTDSVLGSAGDNYISLGTGDGTVNGGDGNDTIVHGGGGAVLLTGGLGSDVYRFARPTQNEGEDTITDFARGIDQLDFDISVFIQRIDPIDLDGDFAADDSYLHWRSESTGATSRLQLLNVQFLNIPTTMADILLVDGAIATVTNGLDGDDIIRGGLASDTIYGGAGNDYLKDGIGGDLLDGGAGNDTLVGSNAAGSANDADMLLGGAGNDQLWGLFGDDTLDGGAGADHMRGGWGDDVYIVDDVGDLVFESAADIGFFDLVQSSVSFVLAFNLERLTLTGAGDITGTGNDLDNVILGNAGANVLRGSDGNDRLIGGHGDDSLRGDQGNDFLAGGAGTNILDGGAGLDRVDLAGLTTGIFFDFASFGSGASVQFGSNSLISIELISQFTDGNDTIVGSAVGFTTEGNGGNDFILGGVAADGQAGGAGNDTMIGGDGDDYLFGGEPGSSSSDTITGTDFDYLYGGNGNDSLRGGSGTNVLIGEQGNDTIEGTGALSYLYSGAGTNMLSSGALLSVILSEGDNDFMLAFGNAYYYRLANGSSSVYGGDGVDQFIGGNALSHDNVRGGGGNDYLFGGNGNDMLTGDAGNDVIIGQGGNDTLEGGAGVNLLWANDAGSDRIFVNVADGGTQVLEFFEAGGTNDAINLVGSNLTSFAGYEALRANIGSVVGGNLLVNAGSGAQLYLNVGASQTAIWFQGVSAYSLTAGDFLFG
jgi:trimeric autotransporter adhesin